MAHEILVFTLKVYNFHLSDRDRLNLEKWLKGALLAFPRLSLNLFYALTFLYAESSSGFGRQDLQRARFRTLFVLTELEPLKTLGFQQPSSVASLVPYTSSLSQIYSCPNSTSGLCTLQEYSARPRWFDMYWLTDSSFSWLRQGEVLDAYQCSSQMFVIGPTTADTSSILRMLCWFNLDNHLRRYLELVFKRSLASNARLLIFSLPRFIVVNSVRRSDYNYDCSSSMEWIPHPKSLGSASHSSSVPAIPSDLELPL
ncbi:hypothetical protein B0H11DRAFT_1933698 [Mycena galericulata]|nr:hypothetical protein B0H11DRAFT_1933698 [Mycena galericulata]